MRKKVGIIKRLFCLLLIFLLSINSFAAIVSDNDGSAFITKAEFDALKSSFQSQIDSYNNSIDSKIDGAIASYLAGIKLSNQVEENFFDGMGRNCGILNLNNITNWGRGIMGLDWTAGTFSPGVNNGTATSGGFYGQTFDIFFLKKPGTGYETLLYNTVAGKNYLVAYDKKCIFKHTLQSYSFEPNSWSTYTSGSDTIAYRWHGSESGRWNRSNDYVGAPVSIKMGGLEGFSDRMGDSSWFNLAASGYNHRHGGFRDYNFKPTGGNGEYNRYEANLNYELSDESAALLFSEGSSVGNYGLWLKLPLTANDCWETDRTSNGSFTGYASVTYNYDFRAYNNNNSAATYRKNWPDGDGATIEIAAWCAPGGKMSGMLYPSKCGFTQSGSWSTTSAIHTTATLGGTQAGAGGNAQYYFEPKFNLTIPSSTDMYMSGIDTMLSDYAASGWVGKIEQGLPLAKLKSDWSQIEFELDFTTFTGKPCIAFSTQPFVASTLVRNVPLCTGLTVKVDGSAYIPGTELNPGIHKITLTWDGSLADKPIFWKLGFKTGATHLPREIFKLPRKMMVTKAN